MPILWTIWSKKLFNHASPLVVNISVSELCASHITRCEQSVEMVSISDSIVQTSPSPFLLPLFLSLFFYFLFFAHTHCYPARMKIVWRCSILRLQESPPVTCIVRELGKSRVFLVGRNTLQGRENHNYRWCPKSSKTVRNMLGCVTVSFCSIGPWM